MMKRWFVLLLTIVLLTVWCSALAEEEDVNYDLLRVGTTTQFSDNFFSGAIGNNVSDQDVRKLIHGYNLVEWVPEEGVFRPNQQVVTAFSSSKDGATFIFAISKDLRYNDGTPITARDYAFSFLLQTSQALKEAAGSRLEGNQISGWKAYDQGEAATVTGFRLIGDYQFSISLSVEYLPFYYEMQALSIEPYPISVLAPGCEIRDDGNGIYLNGDMTADLLRKTILDPETGYAVHPTVTCGPYQMTSYDGTTAVFELNPEHIGDANGQKPYITDITFSYVEADQLINELGEGNLDLVVRCLRNDQIQGGMALTGSGDFNRYAYSRNGLAFISFCAEDGPTSDVLVREAVALCMNKEELTKRYMGSYGTVVDGYYGIGQWMFLAARGTITVENEGEESVDDEAPALGLDGLNAYPLNIERANELLDEAGWNLNEKGQPYDPETDTVRCRGNMGRLQKLELKLICPDSNRATTLLPEYFGDNLAQAGIALEIETMPMADLLERYYHMIDRDCDMIMLGTNFGDVFEPSVEFDGDTHVLSGITDPQFKAMALDMRKTEPGRALEYVQKWIAFLEYRTTILPEIPLYSNAYMDFSVSTLQNYAPGSYSSWAEAVQVAMLSDVTEDEELGDDEFVFD